MQLSFCEVFDTFTLVTQKESMVFCDPTRKLSISLTDFFFFQGKVYSDTIQNKASLEKKLEKFLKI